MPLRQRAFDILSICESAINFIVSLESLSEIQIQISVGGKVYLEPVGGHFGAS